MKINKILIYVLALTACGQCYSSQASSKEVSKPNMLTVKEKAAGWKLLWDGRTSEGWRGRNAASFPASGWVMQDGVLTVLPQNASKGGGDIITEGVFTNFIFKIDFCLTPETNSGIKYFFNPNLDGGTTLEYQLVDRYHPKYTPGRDGNHEIAALYDVMPAQNAKYKSAGEWNTAMIVCNGSHVEHWLNGEKVLTFERGSKVFREAVSKSVFKGIPNWGERKSGHILLQDHHDCAMFRDIKIKILD